MIIPNTGHCAVTPSLHVNVTEIEGEENKNELEKKANKNEKHTEMSVRIKVVILGSQLLWFQTLDLVLHFSFGF